MQMHIGKETGKNMGKFDCPCCGAKGTIDEHYEGDFGICTVCGWEDDGIQKDDPNETGANGYLTLNEARKMWKEQRKLDKRRKPHGK